MTTAFHVAPPDAPPCVEAVLGALPEAAFVEARETHSSYVFLTNDSAFKLKKPVRLPFLDYSTRERRRDMCFEEVRLNQRLAPSIYRGVRGVVYGGDGFRFDAPDYPGAIEDVVWMHRFRDDETLAERLEPDAVERVAARLAEFHAREGLVADIDAGAQARATAEETFATIAELCPPAMRAEVDAGRRFTDAFLRAHREAMRGRPVVDGHGDLRAEHVLVREHGEVEIVDCVEFDPALRRIDPGADLSFLVMDLERLGAPELARALVTGYRAHGGDPGDDASIAFHAAQRAWVRAKVALVTGDVAAAWDLVRLARRLAWRARTPLLLLVCGLSGSGKTTLSRALAEVSGTRVLSSDVVRKELAGISVSEDARDEHYTPAFSRRTYAELGRRADRELRRAGLAVVDATFRDHDDRAAFTASLGWRLGVETRVVECVAPPEVRAARTAARVDGADASDAGPAVALTQRFDPLPDVEHLELHTTRPPAQLAVAVESWLDTP